MKTQRMKNDIQLNGSLLQQIASYTALASIMTYQIPNQQHDGNAAAPLFYSFGTDDEAKPTKKKQWTLLIGGVTTILLLVISGGYRNQIPANTVDAVVASSLPHGLEIEEVNRNSFRSTTTTTAGAAAENDDDTLDHDLTASNTLRSSSTMSLRPRPPHPHMGHKLQLNTSSFTVNDYECLQLDTGIWPSERVHCELLRTTTTNDANEDTKKDDTAHYVFVVEHFDDSHCTQANRMNPTLYHTAAGCVDAAQYNQSYNDICHRNRTLTISAFYGPGCVTPMPVTALNLLPEDDNH